MNSIHMLTAQAAIRAIAERVDRLDGEIKALNADKAVVYAEAKARGYDLKALKAAIRRRRELAGDRQQVEARDALCDLYLAALMTEAEPHVRAHTTIPGYGPVTGDVSLAAAIGNVDTEPHVRAREEPAAHDPETGELVEGPDDDQGSASDTLVTPPAGSGADEIPAPIDLTLPPFLDRRVV